MNANDCPAKMADMNLTIGKHDHKWFALRRRLFGAGAAAFAAFIAFFAIAESCETG